jgi:hypothetical protein
MLITLIAGAVATLPLPLPLPPTAMSNLAESTMENRCFVDSLHDQALALYREDHHLYHCRGAEVPSKLKRGQDHQSVAIPGPSDKLIPVVLQR